MTPERVHAAPYRDAARTTTIVLCILAAVCEGIDLQAAGIAAPGITGELHPSADVLGTFFSSSTFGLFIGALAGGWLSDRRGRRPVLIGSVLLFGLFSIGNALAWDMPSLILMRFATGLGLGGALPNVLALVAENSAPQRKNFNLAAVYSAMPGGGVLISLLSLALPMPRWRLLFIVGGLLPLLIAPFMFRTLNAEAPRRETPVPTSGSPAPASLRSSLDLLLLTRTLLLWSAFFLGLFTLYLLLNWLPTLMLGEGLRRPTVTIIQVGFNAGGVVTALLIGRLLESRWRRTAVAVAFIALPLLIRSLAQMPSQVSLLIAVVVALGSAVLASQAFLYATAPLLYPRALRGLGVGVAVAVGRLGSFLGPKYGGVWKGLGLGSSGVLLHLLPIAIVGSVFAILLSWLPLARTDDST